MRRTLFLLLTLLTGALLASCETEVREAIVNQEKYIDDYIQKNFEDFEVIRNQGVNSIILVDTLLGAPAIEKGDSTFLFLAGHIFEQKGPTIQSVRDSGMFRIGTGDLIPGLDRGLVGAHLGERRLIIFTSKYGYGENAVGLVDENTALLFEVLVAAIKKD